MINPKLTKLKYNPFLWGVQHEIFDISWQKVNRILFTIYAPKLASQAQSISRSSSSQFFKWNFSQLTSIVHVQHMRLSHSSHLNIESRVYSSDDRASQGWLPSTGWDPRGHNWGFLLHRRTIGACGATCVVSRCSYSRYITTEISCFQKRKTATTLMTMAAMSAFPGLAPRAKFSCSTRANKDTNKYKIPGMIAQQIRYAREIWHCYDWPYTMGCAQRIIGTTLLAVYDELKHAFEIYAMDAFFALVDLTTAPRSTSDAVKKRFVFNSRSSLIL